MNFKIKNKISYLLVLGLVAYGIISIFKTQIEVYAKQQELNALNAEIEAQQMENDELNNILDPENEEDYILQVARSQFGYSYPNERVYIDISGN